MTNSDLPCLSSPPAGVPRSVHLTLLASFLCGIASVLAFAPFGLWPILLPAVGYLFVLIYFANSSKRSFFIGYVYGLGFFGAGVYWVYFSLHLFGSAIAPLAAAGTMLCTMILALYTALFANIVWRFKSYSTGWLARVSWFFLAAPAALVLIEWLRSWFLTGFPWLSLGYSTINSPLAGYAPVGGVFLNSLLVAFCCGAVAFIFVQRSLVSALITMAFVITLAAGGQKLRDISWTKASGEPVSVTMVQGNIAQELKFLPNLLQDSLEIYSGFSKTGADLVIWPESAIPTFFIDVDGWQAQFLNEMQNHGSVVLSGGFHSNEDFSEYYNAIKVLGGTEDQIYTKRHLVPFGEFIPFRNIVKFLAEYIMIPMSDLHPGRGPVKPITINDVHYGMSICYEDAFGTEMLAQLPQSNVLINVSNDAWFGDSTAPHQHQEIAAMRSLEFERPMLRVTNTGISAFISERGEIIAQGQQFEAMAMDVQVIPREGSTPFVTVGNWLAVLLAAAMFLIHWVVGGSAKEFK